MNDREIKINGEHGSFNDQVALTRRGSAMHCIVCTVLTVIAENIFCNQKRTFVEQDRRRNNKSSINYKISDKRH